MKGLMSGTLGSPFAGRRMCCARTAALQGGCEKLKVNATSVIFCSDHCTMFKKVLIAMQETRFVAVYAMLRM